MLVLGRKQGESIRIGEGIDITIVAIQGNRVRLGIKAPDDVRVLRAELEAKEGQDSRSMSPSSAGLVGEKLILECSMA